jgi:hypothetical protein
MTGAFELPDCVKTSTQMHAIAMCLTVEPRRRVLMERLDSLLVPCTSTDLHVLLNRLCRRNTEITEPKKGENKPTAENE